MDLQPYASQVWARMAIVPGDVSSEERERHALVAYLEQHIARPIVEAGRTRDAMEEAADALLDDGVVARAAAFAEHTVQRRRPGGLDRSTRELRRRLRDARARQALNEGLFWAETLAKAGPITLAKGLPTRYPDTLDAMADQPFAIELLFRAMNRGLCARWVLGVASGTELRHREHTLAEMDAEGWRALARIYAGSGAGVVADALRARALSVPDFDALRRQHEVRLAIAASLARNVPLSARDTFTPRASS